MQDNNKFWLTGQHPITGWYTGKTQYPKDRYPKKNEVQPKTDAVHT